MRKIAILAAAMVLLPLAARAEEIGFRGKASAAIDWKVTKGLHLEAEYSLWTKDSFKGINKNYVGIGASYKFTKWLKIGAGYTFIGKNGTSGFCPRHRFDINATGTLRAGAWRFSLREQLQLTHKSYEINRFQEVPNLLELRSRIKVSYKTRGCIDPYLSVELRNCFNSPSFNATYNATTGKYTDYEFLGYGDTYLNRVRTNLGIEWTIARRHAIDFGVIMDYNHRKKIDTNKEGTKLKDLYWNNRWTASVAVGYKFSF